MVVAEKVLERVILDRILTSREARCRESQAGFRFGRSCADQIFTLKRILRVRSEWNLPVVAVALDFASAYDSVDRESLFRILEAEGMCCKTLRVIKAMLQGTKARVRIGKEETEEFEIVRGVKQGSVLSPSLFVAVMDWVLHEALDGKVRGIDVDGMEITDLDYADDVLLLTDSIQQAQVAINRVQEAGRKVGLELNAKKTVWLAKNVKPAKLYVNGTEIEKSESIVYLGSQVDADGGMSEEVDRRVNAANRVFWSFRRLWKNNHVSLQTKARVYAASVRSALMYGAENWALTEKQLYTIEVFDRKRLRWIAGIKWSDKISNHQLMEKVKLDTLDTFIMRRRWQWLGHILRMSPKRWPRRVIEWKEDKQYGARRSAGAPKKSWNRIVAKESWDNMQHWPWKELNIKRPKIEYENWKNGDCWLWLRSWAMCSNIWRKIVEFVSSYKSDTACCGPQDPR